ncbi:MAG: helix-turn-helix transcriptional regulator [Kangiellaceae bacterium]|jgi:transcriptional regulator with XRE-family HTH domain|nr:helix-turn-helix transcriptional regulator [Kangiellaceae bacterium]
MEINASLLKQLRNKKGWTQQQLAEIADLSLRTIQRIEKTGSASNESISALCVCFQVDREELLIVPRVSKDDLQRVNQVSLPVLIAVAMLTGGLLGSLVTYIFM